MYSVEEAEYGLNRDLLVFVMNLNSQQFGPQQLFRNSNEIKNLLQFVVGTMFMEKR